MITTHDERHKGKAVRNYGIKMSVYCLLSTQISGFKTTQISMGSQGVSFWQGKAFGIPKPSDLQSDPSVSSHLTGWAGSVLERGITFGHHQQSSGEPRSSCSLIIVTNGGDKGSSCKVPVPVTDHACHVYILSAMNITSLEPWGSGIGLPLYK